MRARVLLVSIVVGALGAAIPAEAVGELTPVLKSKRVEFVPFAAPGWFGWSEARAGLPLDPAAGKPGLMVRPDGGEAFRVNPRGTAGLSGAIDGDRLTYDLQTGKDEDSIDIAFFDLKARVALAAPAGLNTRLREDNSSSSGDWLLFRRSKSFLSTPQTIVLRNLKTGEERIIGRGDGGGHYAQPGRVEGDYANWFRCHGLDRCDIFLHKISTGSTTEVPNPKGVAQYAASVGDDGTVYFVESTSVVCGRRPAVWRYTPEGVRERLGRLPDGGDALATFPLENGPSTTVFLDVIDCTARTFKSDIYSVTV